MFKLTRAAFAAFFRVLADGLSAATPPNEPEREGLKKMFVTPPTDVKMPVSLPLAKPGETAAYIPYLLPGEWGNYHGGGNYL